MCLVNEKTEQFAMLFQIEVKSQAQGHVSSQSSNVAYFKTVRFSPTLYIDGRESPFIVCISLTESELQQTHGLKLHVVGVFSESECVTVSCGVWQFFSSNENATLT